MGKEMRRRFLDTRATAANRKHKYVNGGRERAPVVSEKGARRVKMSQRLQPVNAGVTSHRPPDGVRRHSHQNNKVGTLLGQTPLK